MTRRIKKLLIGVSVVVGASTMGAVPTSAASLTGIEFDTTDIAVYKKNSVVTLPDLLPDSYDNLTKREQKREQRRATRRLNRQAISALTDDNPFTNVELGFSSETQTENFGFSGMLGGKEVEVETVTAEDWNVFGDQWVADFTAAYSQFGPFAEAIGKGIKEMGAIRFGDPNVGGFTFDESSGEYQLDLIGHYNVLNAPYLQGTPEAAMVSALLGGNPLQISEIAKVTIDGVVNYAYSFSATETGFVAADAAPNDTSSHTGLYSWTFTPKSVQSVPEPSTMLGLMAVGGLVTLSQRKSRNKV